MSKENLIMVDFARHDIRSVAAMLRGQGDGREEKLNEFMTREALKDPLVSEEKLTEDFKIQSQAEFNRDIHEIRSKVGDTWIDDKPKRSLLGFLKLSS